MKIKNKKRRVHRRHVGLLAIALTALMAGVLLAWGLSIVTSVRAVQSGRLVTFYDRGQQHVILTHADKVRDALSDAGIVVSSQDKVEPAIDTALLSSDSIVIIYRAQPVLVVDGALRQKVVTAAAAPREIMRVAAIDPLRDKDETTFTKGDFFADGASKVLTIKRAALPLPPAPAKVVFGPTPKALTITKGAQLYTDSDGVAHRETYYDLPMNIVIGACGGGGYTIRAIDGAKVDKDGYVLVAANYNIYPRCSVVETSMGPGKVYDTGGFVKRYPHGFDLATDWTRRDGR